MQSGTVTSRQFGCVVTRKQEEHVREVGRLKLSACFDFGLWFVVLWGFWFDLILPTGASQKIEGGTTPFIFFLCILYILAHFSSFCKSNIKVLLFEYKHANDTIMLAKFC